MFQDLLTVDELAQWLKVPCSWVYKRTRLRGRKRLPHVKLGKYLRFDPKVIEQWLKEQADGKTFRREDDD